MIELTVLICSHNPVPEYLAQTLAALRKQTLATDRWELLLVDNASKSQLSQQHAVDWHPNGRQFREDKVGKLNALILGFREARGKIIIIVDDDNVLDADYLENALAVAARHPDLGAWGGNVTLKFETRPAGWTEKYWPFLAQQKVEEEIIQHTRALCQHMPVGAGCCVRREVTELYVKQLQTSSWRQALGRNGANLMAGEDTDLVLTAGDLGLNIGLFKTLNLTHLIPPARLEEDYLVRLASGVQYSLLILEFCRDPDKAPPRANFWWWFKFFCDCAFKFGRRRRFYLGYKRAQRKARAVYDSLYPAA